MAKVVVVIPTYNERDNIAKMIEALAVEFPKIKDHRMELLVVDDTSPDKTYEVVREKAKRYKWVNLLLNATKEGLGKAYAKGFRYAMEKMGADYIMEFDGDFQHRPDEIKRLVAKINEGYEYIIGSRYIKGGSIPEAWGFDRKLLSVVGNLVARVGLLMPKIHDVTTGFKLTKVKGVMDQVPLEHLYSNSFAYKVHILADCVNRGAKVVEVPITFEARERGKSKIINNEMLETLKVIFLFQIHNPKIIRFVKFGIVGFVGFLVNYLGLELLKRLGLSTYFATLFATEMAIISNFVFNNVWTFKDKAITKISDVIPQFIKFNVSSLFAVIVQPLIVTGFSLLFGDTSIVRLIALVFALIVVIIPYNYAVYNIFIWKTWKVPLLDKLLKKKQ